MRITITLILSPVILAACTDQQRAERLASTVIIPTLENPESYEFLHCEVDSAYDGTIQTTEQFITLINMQRRIEERTPVMKRIEHNLAIYDSICKEDKKRHITNENHLALLESTRKCYYEIRDEYYKQVAEMNDLLEEYGRIVSRSSNKAIGMSLAITYAIKGEQTKAKRHRHLIITDFGMKKILFTANNDSIKMLQESLHPVPKLPRLSE